MLNVVLLNELKNDLIKRSKEINNNFVSLCLDSDSIKMYHTVSAYDFLISDDDITIEVENFILSIASRSLFKIEKNKNDIETEYILKNDSLKLCINI